MTDARIPADVARDIVDAGGTVDTVDAAVASAIRLFGMAPSYARLYVLGTTDTVERHH